MSMFNKIFVVIDPTTDNQIALSNAAQIAGQNKTSAIHLYGAVYSTGSANDTEALKRVELARHRAWITSLLEPLNLSANDVSIEVEWTSEWRDAIAPAAARAGADLIVKAASSHSGTGRRLLKTSDWTLLRNSQCPVYLIKKDNLDDNTKVLVALDIAREGKLHSKLNARVIEYGRALVDSVPESSLHAVNAYPDADNFIYQPDLAQATGIERTDAHAMEGAPEKAIPEVAEKIGAGIVVIGTAARDGLKAAVIGNTSEKILDAVHTNILTVTAG